MSHPTRPSRDVPVAGPNDLLALTRALVFTKEAYGRLRLKAAPRPDPAGGLPTPSLTMSANAAVAGSTPAGPSHRASTSSTAGVGVAAAPGRPLTPWELMDEGDATHGVTFADFQRRPQESFVQDAA